MAAYDQDGGVRKSGQLHSVRGLTQGRRINNYKIRRFSARSGHGAGITHSSARIGRGSARSGHGAGFARRSAQSGPGSNRSRLLSAHHNHFFARFPPDRREIRRRRGLALRARRAGHKEDLVPLFGHFAADAAREPADLLDVVPACGRIRDQQVRRGPKLPVPIDRAQEIHPELVCDVQAVPDVVSACRNPCQRKT